MSREIYTARLRAMTAQLQNAKSDRVRAVLLAQMSQVQRKLKQIEMQPAKEYLAQLEAKYSNSAETLEQTEEPAKRGRKKKDTE